MLRGFLNDGTTDYKSHHSVDSLAFGHCQYSYRNLGRPSNVKVQQDSQNFKVEIDGKLCFESQQIQLPTGYTFGITAASAETPDSFEVFKLAVQIPNPGMGQAAPMVNSPPKFKDPRTASQQSRNPSLFSPDAEGDLPELSADAIEQSKQFADLHYRLQSVMKHISTFQREFNQFSHVAQERHDELKGVSSVPFDQLNAMDRRLEALERSIQQISKDVGSQDYRTHIDELSRTVRESHSSLLEGVTGSIGHIVTGSAPRLGFFIFVVLGFQALLALSYVIYKRRRANAPKKYL